MACDYVTGWVRPRFVERLLRDGVRGVLVVRDARAESAVRDGNRWVSDRLSGIRKPSFRPDRAGDGQWCIADFTPGGDRALLATAAAFRTSNGPPAARPRSKTTTLAAGTVVIIALTAVAIAPSHLRVNNPAPSAPELVFSFKILGEMQTTGALDPAEEAKKPVHMRGRVTEKSRRQPVTVKVTVDGTPRERTFSPKGIGGDGPAIDEWRQTLTHSPRAVTIEILHSAQSEPLQWSGTIQATERRLHVITFQPGDGFRLEDSAP